MKMTKRICPKPKQKAFHMESKLQNSFTIYINPSVTSGEGRAHLRAKCAGKMLVFLSGSEWPHGNVFHCNTSLCFDLFVTMLHLSSNNVLNLICYNKKCLLR